MATHLAPLGKVEGDAGSTRLVSCRADAAEAWETGLGQHILRSCRELLGELEHVKLNVRGDGARDLCRAEWAVTKARMDDMANALAWQAARPVAAAAREPDSAGSRLVRASRQTAGALRSCVQALASSTELDTADGAALRASATALHAMTLEMRQLFGELRSVRTRAARGLDTMLAEPDGSHVISASASESEDPRLQSTPTPAAPRPPAPLLSAAEHALQAATGLAELLRIFTRVSQQSWAATRSQLAHAPSVPSPLASGSSTQRHRRWVSEELDAELAPAPGLHITVDGRPLVPVPASHMRNRSDSRLLVGAAAPIPRKSALSLRRPSHSLTGSPPAADVAERARQVRFQAAAMPPVESPVDQARLQELALLLSQFEKAIAALQAALCAGAEDPAACAPAIRGLAAAFLHISRLSSSTAMVRHYDKPTLAQFKAATNAIKLLMPLCPKPQP